LCIRLELRGKQKERIHAREGYKIRVVSKEYIHSLFGLVRKKEKRNRSLMNLILDICVYVCVVCCMGEEEEEESVCLQSKWLRQFDEGS